MKPIDIFNLSEEEHAKLADILTEGLPNGCAHKFSKSELEDMRTLSAAFHGGDIDNPSDFFQVNGFKIKCCCDYQCGSWTIRDNGEGSIDRVVMRQWWIDEWIRIYDEMVSASRKKPESESAKAHNKMVVATLKQLENKEWKQNNLGRKVLANMIKAFEACGVSKINLQAGKDVGPYFWARAGAVPEGDEWEKLKPILSKKLDDMISNKEIDGNDEAIQVVRTALEKDSPKAMWVIADSTIGNKLLYNTNSYEADKKDLPDTRWYGQIDLNDPDVKTRLYSYLEKARHVDKSATQAVHGGAAL